MNFSNIKLANPLPITLVLQTFYTVPASSSTIVTVLTIANTTADTIPFSVYLCPSGVSASVDNALLYLVPLDGNTAASFNFGQVLSAGDTIQVVANEVGLVLHGSGIVAQ